MEGTEPRPIAEIIFPCLAVNVKEALTSEYQERMRQNSQDCVCNKPQHETFGLSNTQRTCSNDIIALDC